MKQTAENLWTFFTDNEKKAWRYGAKGGINNIPTNLMYCYVTANDKILGWGFTGAEIDELREELNKIAL